LQACIINFGANWARHLLLVEFAYNNSYQSTIGMPPFETLYGRRYKSLICWEEVSDMRIFGSDLIQETTKKIKIIKKRMRIAKSRQKAYADRRPRLLEFAVGDKVFLKVSPIKGMIRINRKSKLSPRFIGPFEILERVRPVAYRLPCQQNWEEFMMCSTYHN